MAKESFAVFCDLIWEYEFNWHLDILIDRLEKIEAGLIDRQIISMPPRHGKSLTATQLFVAWYLGRNPTERVILVCGGKKLAKDAGTAIRKCMDKDIYKRIFPEATIPRTVKSKVDFNIVGGGSCYIISRRTQIIGLGANLLIIDDPYNGSKEADSIAIRNEVWEFFISNAYQRLEPNGKIIIIHTRWHSDDLIGRLTDPENPEDKDTWSQLVFQAIAEEDEEFREAGEALWPQRWPKEKLLRIRNKGERSWSAQYMQRPVSKDIAKLNIDNFRTYDWTIEEFFNPGDNHLIPAIDLIIISMDTASEIHSYNDYTVITAWACCSGKMYLIKILRKKLLFPQLREAVKDFYNEIAALAEYIPISFLVENRDAGKTILQLKDLDFKDIPLKAVKATTGKSFRANNFENLLENRKLYLPYHAVWRETYTREVGDFPSGKNDDQVDSSSQAMNEYIELIKRENRGASYNTSKLKAFWRP